MSGKDVIHQQRELTSTIAEPWEVVTAEEYSGSYQLKGHELDTMYRSEDIGKRVLPSGGGGAPQRLTMRLIAECTGAAANTSTTERSLKLFAIRLIDGTRIAFPKYRSKPKT